MGVAYQRGAVLFAQERYREAAVQLRAELDETPHDVQAHALLALCLLNDGQPEAALVEADEAVRLNPEGAGAHFARAQVLPHVPINKPLRSFRLSRSSGDDTLKRLRRARAALDEALRLEPHDATLHAYAADLEASRGRWVASLRAAEQALAIAPKDVNAANHRARALTVLGRAHEADEVIGQALCIDPEFAPSYSARGWSLLRSGRADEARVAFLESLRLEPLHASSRHGLLHARLATCAVYRWPLRFILGRAQGVGVELAGTAGAFTLAFLLKIARHMSWPAALGGWAGLMLILLLVVRPVVHWTAGLRR